MNEKEILLYQDREWLYDQIVVKGLSDTEIGEMFGVDRKTISYWRINKFNIKRTKEKKESKYKIKLNEDDTEFVLIQYFQEKRSLLHIGNELSVSPQVIARTIREEGLEPRNVGESSRIYTANDNFFSVIDSEKKAYWLGFLYADGCVREDRGTVRLGLQSVDEDHVIKFIKDIDSTNPVKHWTKRSGGKEYFTSYVNIYSRQMVEDLVKLGCNVNKSLTLEFPTEDQVPSQFMNAFIRGYFDGDGSISHSTPYNDRRQYRYSVVGTKEFLDEMKIRLDISHLKTSKRKTNIYCVGTCGATQVERVMSKIYEDATVYLSRKYEKYQEMLRYIEENPSSRIKKIS